MKDLIRVDASSLARWNKPIPRYTSYPTAPQFHPLDESIYRQKLALFDASSKPLSVYIHIPFCKTMCLFCACSVILNRKPEKQREYLDLLLKEIELLPFASKRKVTQLHLGGGTPTSLSESEFEELMAALGRRFSLEGEISIEVDPRTVYSDGGKKLAALRKMGFNRVSFGVQDLDPLVQEAVKRRQSEEMTVSTLKMARSLGFEGINLDLIYGLPHQTPERFAKTAEKILELKPDRIAFYSYAKVPWLKAHQKAIPDETLPTTEEKFAIYAETRERFLKGGYMAIGMDHFALETDPMAAAYAEKKLTRNFQGYSLQLADDMIGLGVTSIGFLENAFFQNLKTIEAYKGEVEQGRLPVHRGYVLNGEDRLRRFVIQAIMCQFELDKRQFERRFGKSFDGHFSREREEIERLKTEGLLEETEEKLLPTPMGRLFIRLIAAVFDAYIQQGNYSRAV